MSTFYHLLICYVVFVYIYICISICILFYSQLQSVITKIKSILYATSNHSTIMKLRRIEHWFDWAGDVVQWVEYVLHTQGLGFCTQHSIKLGIQVHAYNPKAGKGRVIRSSRSPLALSRAGNQPCFELLSHHKTKTNKQEKLASSLLWFWLPSPHTPSLLFPEQPPAFC